MPSEADFVHINHQDNDLRKFKCHSYLNRLREIDGSTRLSTILESIFDSPFAQITDTARKLGVHYQTAQADLEKLRQAKILVELPNFRPKTYYAREVFNVAYEKLL